MPVYYTTGPKYYWTSGSTTSSTSYYTTQAASLDENYVKQAYIDYLQKRAMDNITEEDIMKILESDD